MNKISHMFKLLFLALCCTISSISMPIVTYGEEEKVVFTYDGAHFTSKSDSAGVSITQQQDSRVEKVAKLNEGTITIRFRLAEGYTRDNAVYTLFGLANPDNGDKHFNIYVVPSSKRIGMEQMGTSETNNMFYTNVSTFKQDESWQTITITKAKDNGYGIFVNDGNVLRVSKSNTYPQNKFLDYFFDTNLADRVELNIGYSNRNLNASAQYHMMGDIDMISISEEVLSDEEAKQQNTKLNQERDELVSKFTNLINELENSEDQLVQDILSQAKLLDTNKALSKEIKEMLNKLQEVQAGVIKVIPTNLDEVKKHNQESKDWHRLQAMLASEEAINWVFTGDSITHGAYTAKAYKAYPEYFEQYLKTSTINGIKRNRDLVINTGVSNAVSQELINWKEGYILNKKPDVVFIAIGMNDQTIAYRDEGTKDTIATPQQVQAFKKRMEELVQIVESSGAIPVLTTQNHRSEMAYKANMDLYAKAIREVAIEQDVILMDVNMQFLVLNNNDVTNMTYMNDSVHPNYKGYFEWAKFIIEQLEIKDETNELFKLTYDDLLVSYDDQNIKINNQVSNLIGSRNEDALLKYEIGKLFDGVNYLIKDDEVNDLFDNENNITIRFKVNSNDEQTLVSFTNQDNTKATSVKLINGMVRITINENGTNQYYSKDFKLTNDVWHTLSINFNKTKASIYLDGNITSKQEIVTDLSLNRELYNQLTIGASRGSNYPNGVNQFKGIIDYVEISKGNLTDEQIATLTKETREIDASLFTKHFNNNTNIQMWSYVGGATLEGVMNEYSTKNFVQTFNEVYRWEAYGQGQIQRSKFYVNHAHDGLTMKYFNDNYEKIVGVIKQGNGNDTLTILPDIYDREGNLVEGSVEEFKTNLESLVQKAKDDQRTVLLMTPIMIDESLNAYVEVMKEVAESKQVALANSYQYFMDANKHNASIERLWFDNDGFLNCVGQNQLSRYLCGLMGLKGTQTFTLDYYTQVECEVSELKPKVERKLQQVIIDVAGLRDMPYFFSEFKIYEFNGTNKDLVASSNENVIIIDHVDNQKHLYEIEARVGKEANVIKYVIFKAEVEVINQVDKQELSQLVEEAKKIDTSNKTVSSIALLEKVIKESEQLLNDDKASQSDVDNMITKLQQAIDNLEDNKFIYDDVKESDWFYKVVELITKLKLMGFDGNSTCFKPNKHISRGMVATIMHRLAKCPKANKGIAFKDNHQGLWYSEAIDWISEEGIVRGYDSGYFGVDDDITREDLAIMIRNYANHYGINTNSKKRLNEFKDYQQISDYAKSALAWCVEQGIISGSNHYLKPQGKASRAECAKMFVLLNNIIK